MRTIPALQPVAENLWLMTFPLKVMGADLRRNVTVIRLRSGKLVIHSTAPFVPEDIEEIYAVGEPGWLLDGVLRHDTFAKEGRAAFPDIPYLAPPGFSVAAGVPTLPLVPAPPEWTGELSVVEIEGAPEARDTAMLHHASRTLILTEMLFNFDLNEPVWTEILLFAAVGTEHHPGMSRPFRWGITDEAAFKDSMRVLLTWDFDRIMVGHGDVIETGGKVKLGKALHAAGLEI